VNAAMMQVASVVSTEMVLILAIGAFSFGSFLMNIVMLIALLVRRN